MKIAVIGSNTSYKIFKTIIANPKKYIHIKTVECCLKSNFSHHILLHDWNDSFGINKALLDVVKRKINKS